MARLLPLVVLAAVLAAAPAAAQATGTLTGRISDAAFDDRNAGALPGVRITVTGPEWRGEAITDGSGRFSLSALPFGHHEITAFLAGFTPVIGHLNLSATQPTAQLDWSLKVGCLQEVVQVVIDLPEAARDASLIAHVRVTGDGPITQWSTTPECGFLAAREYPVSVVEAVPGDHAAAAAATMRRLFTPALDPLAPGAEYLVLLRWDAAFERHWTMGPYYVARIDNGRVSRDGPKELQGLPVADALKRLQQWAGK